MPLGQGARHCKISATGNGPVTTPAWPLWPSYGFAFQRITAFVRLAVLPHRLVIRLNANPIP